MLKLFYVCFYIGIIYTAATFILGYIFDFMGLDGDIGFDGDFFGYGISPIKPVVIAVFLTIFGGVGIIAHKNNLTSRLSLILALVIAISISFLIFRFILVPLHRMQSKEVVGQNELIGHIAKAVLTIKEDECGKIAYTINGNTYSAPARSENKETIDKGEEVVIVNIEHNIFYVKKLKEEGF